MSILITIIIFFIILGVLVLVHELGHYLVAIRNGIKAHEFGFGFPPRIGGFYKNENGKWKFLKGNKEYQGKNTLFSFNAIPLGGFVRIKGENGEEMGEDSFATKSIWTRFKVLIAGVTMNVILAWFLTSLVLIIGAPEVLQNSEGNFKIAPFGISIFERENYLKYDFSQVNEGSALKTSGGKSILFGHFVFDTDKKVENLVIKKSSEVMIDLILKDSVAEKAGIKIGDKITEICLENGECQEIKTGSDLQLKINRNANKLLIFSIKRGEKIEKISVTPIEKDGKGMIGISFAELFIVKYPWYKAIFDGLFKTIDSILAILGAFFMMIKSLFGGQSVSQNLSGPIGIAILVKQIKDLGLVYIFMFTASLSVNLAIINALPIPALDGGRILFLIIEKIKGKPVNQKVEGIIHTVSFFLLLALIFIISFHDITNIIK